MNADCESHPSSRGGKGKGAREPPEWALTPDAAAEALACAHNRHFDPWVVQVCREFSNVGMIVFHSDLCESHTI